MQTRTIDWLDRAPLVGSAACMVHCLALPLLLAAAPVSIFFFIPESFHHWVIAFAAPAAVIALSSGRARHRTVFPVAFGCVGLTLLLLGAFVFPEGQVETIAVVFGGVSLATAHILNWRSRRAC
ncbi:MerC domain-containing protein [Sphingomonas sp. PB2P12]|uniref:MerC domain-containing protein n=1 Tax=Sphingomonas sandaracina TaxID=3096157 RepID=UPI002FCB5E92